VKSLGRRFLDKLQAFASLLMGKKKAPNEDGPKFTKGAFGNPDHGVKGGLPRIRLANGTTAR
jgi:hypothetical protein